MAKKNLLQRPSKVIVKRQTGDFDKKRQRPGKLNPGAVNKTDTSFRALSIHVKAQHLLPDIPPSSDSSASSQAVWEGLLLTLQRHYSPRNRRDAYRQAARLLRTATMQTAELCKLAHLMQPVLFRCVSDVDCHGEALALFSSFFQLHVRMGAVDSLRSLFPDPLLKFLWLAATNVNECCRRGVLDFVRELPSALMAWADWELLRLVASLVVSADFDQSHGNDNKTAKTRGDNNRTTMRGHASLDLLHGICTALIDQLERTSSSSSSGCLRVSWNSITCPDLALLNHFRYAPNQPRNAEDDWAALGEVSGRLSRAMLLPWQDVAYLATTIDSSTVDGDGLAEPSSLGVDNQERVIWQRCLGTLRQLFRLFKLTSEFRDGRRRTGGEEEWAAFCGLLDAKMHRSIGLLRGLIAHFSSSPCL
jgi:hypothetical protein